jgi:two-component system NtrC family sensor kinase
VAQGDPDEEQEACERLTQMAQEVDVEFVLGDLAKAIRESQEGSERIRHIVHDLRDFSYQDTGERVLADINQCLESTANIVWPMMKHLVVLEKQYHDLPALNCYPMQLKQVFMNLLVNAHQAIEEKLGDDGETGRIQLRTEHRGDQIVVTVADTGAGIAPGNLDRIFDPFFTTKKVGSGTGLGLSTSYSIVQRHGGAIRVESTPGRGTTFRVLLPVDEDDAEA